MKYIKLNIQAPFMSFGDATSKFQNTRDTGTKPTKSMVIGLVACAMGIPRGDARIKQLNNNLFIQTTTINKKATLWQDYQNAHIRELDEMGRYGSNDAKNIQRWKTYVLNGNYIVFVGSEDEQQLVNIYNALSHPFWPLFAGRKCCTLSSRVTENSLRIYDESELNDIINIHNQELEENITLCICQ